MAARACASVPMAAQTRRERRRCRLASADERFARLPLPVRRPGATRIRGACVAGGKHRELSRVRRRDLDPVASGECLRRVRQPFPAPGRNRRGTDICARSGRLGARPGDTHGLERRAQGFRGAFDRPYRGGGRPSEHRFHRGAGTHRDALSQRGRTIRLVQVSNTSLDPMTARPGRASSLFPLPALQRKADCPRRCDQSWLTAPAVRIFSTSIASSPLVSGCSRVSMQVRKCSSSRVSGMPSSTGT
jgi:hypothetical protein